MKHLILIIFLFASILLKAQIIERRIYTIVAPSFNQQHHRPTAGIPLIDGGFCIGGEVDYIIDNGGPQPLYSERTFILMIDSNYNISWIDTSDLMEDNGYGTHEVNSIFQTSDSGIVFDQTHEYSYIRNVTKNDFNGNRLWEQNFYDSINLANMAIGFGEMVYDTILYPGTKYYGLHHDPYIVITTTHGDTVFYKNSVELGCTSDHRVQVIKDFTGQLYCVLSKSSTNTIVHGIKSDGSIISTYQIPYNNLNNDAKAIAISSSRIMLCYPRTAQPQYIYNNDQSVLDSTSFNAHMSYIVNGLDVNILMLTLFNTGPQGTSILPEGRNFLEIDSTGKIVWGYNFGSVNDSDVITYVRQINSTDYIFLGNFYSSISSGAYPVLFERFRRPQFMNTLSLDTGFLCEGDSVLITAPSGYSYKWNTGDSTQYIYAKAVGNYYTLLSDTNGFFVASTSALITGPVLPSLGNDTVICTYQPLVLDAGAGYNSYLWNEGSTLQTLTVVDSSSGWVIANYSVTVVDTNGCIASDTITVTFDVCFGVSEFDLQNAFILYPNPAQNKLSLKNKFNLEGEIKLIDHFGRCLVLLKLTRDHKELQVDLINIPTGVYLIEYSSNLNSARYIAKISVVK